MEARFDGYIFIRFLHICFGRYQAQCPAGYLEWCRSYCPHRVLLCEGTLWNLNTDLITSSLADNNHSCIILSCYVGFTGVFKEWNFCSQLSVSPGQTQLKDLTAFFWGCLKCLVCFLPFWSANHGGMLEKTSSFIKTECLLVTHFCTTKWYINFWNFYKCMVNPLPVLQRSEI